ncbi:MAG: hypothetical protein ACT4R6_01895 [Gemmatimonadaceae bacterium]
MKTLPERPGTEQYRCHQFYGLQHGPCARLLVRRRCMRTQVVPLNLQTPALAATSAQPSSADVVDLM